MHEGEFTIDEQLVHDLIAAQFHAWSHLPLTPVRSSGTVNAIYRLGSELAVRLPRLPEFSASVERETRWLPQFSGGLPLEVPEPVAMGSPTQQYPSPWSIVRWIDGVNATATTLTDMSSAAIRLGRFVRALRTFDTTGGPTDSYRGRPLAQRDSITRRSIKEVADEFNVDALTHAWEAALAVPAWSGIPEWFHGDLHSGNLLARGGKLAAVIDFGICSVGEASSDLIAAWWLFDEESRQVFRDTVQPDDDSWNRGRGWALSVALVAVPYYIDSNTVFADMARAAIRSVLADAEMNS